VNAWAKGSDLASVDVSIRGAGIFGLSIAWTCLQAGARVEVIDSNGVAAGASGGIVGALAPHVPENWNPKKAFQLDSLLMAEGFWSGVEEAGGVSPGYVRSGRIQPISKGGERLASDRALGAEALWQDRATWKVVSSVDRWQLGSETGLFIADTLSALIHPRQACIALAAALEAKGARLDHEAAASAGSVIWATGTEGLNDLSQALNADVGTPVKGQAALFDLDRRGAGQVFVDGLHIIPHLDGTVAIGSTTERDPVSPNTTDHQLDALIDKARHLVPDLAEAPVVARWAGLRPRARTRAPMLGAWPNRPGHFVANGGFKIGFGMAPKVAEVMRDLVLAGIDQIPEGFRVEDSLLKRTQK